jgi:Putative phage serine protease XkdF
VVRTCLDCGCGLLADRHGDGRHLTIDDLQAAAEASGISLVRAAANILQTVTGTLCDNDPEPDGPVRQFLAGCAYQCGPTSRIAKGVDGGRDFMTAPELERAAWNFMLKGQQHGLFHVDGTEGAARTVESAIYRNPIPWVISDDLMIRKGDWYIGALLNDTAWSAYEAGRIGGFSPQGVARRRRVAKG